MVKRIAVIIVCVLLIIVGILVLTPKEARSELPNTTDSDISEEPTPPETEIPEEPSQTQPENEPDTPPIEEPDTVPDEPPEEQPETDIPEQPNEENSDDPADDLPEEPLPEKDPIVRLCIGGDTSIDSEFADAAVKWGVDYPWKEVSDIFSSADISIVNLETCVSDRGVSEKRKGYGFRTPPEMLEGFVNAGIDMVNLANNHTRDFGYDALLDTFDHLSANGIDYFGAGKDIDEAAGLVIKEVDGLKVGFAGCNYVYLTDGCAADVDHAGINMIYKLNDERTQAFLDRIKEYDSQCDVLIVFLHCGTEEVFTITSNQKNLSKALIDNGADIIIGGHSHTLQPIEFYNGKPIFYSIGNLIFWHIDDELDGLTCIFDITLDKNGFAGLKLHPLFIKNYKVYLLKDGSGKHPTRYTQIINLMNELCNPNGIAFDSEGNMTKYIPPEITDEPMADIF